MPDGGSPEEAVRRALKSNSTTSALEGVPLVPVPGGLSNHAWRAEMGGRSYFVRLGGRDAERLGVDRHSECTLLETVAAAGLSPAVLACDPASDLLVTQFVDGEPWHRADAHEPRNLRRLGEALRRLHQLPVPAGVRRVSFHAQAGQLEAQLEGAGVVERAVKRAVGPAFERLSSRPECVALCHNDLHHLNLLDSGDRLWVVDWEYGGCGDLLFDFASFLCQHESGPAEQEALLDAYGDRQAVAPDLVAAARRAFDYVQWLWYRLWVERRPAAGAEYADRAAAIAQRLLARGP
jgi:thiamine kinase-like enzyme